MADFYDSSDPDLGAAIYSEIRTFAYGDDLGQSGWLTRDELVRFAEFLALGPGTRLLDVGCGSGGPALWLGENVGCQILGVDSRVDGVARGNAMAVSSGLENRVRFDTVDVSQPLPFQPEAFDAIMCVDAINHLPDRAMVLSDWVRVVRPGGRVLFTDPVVVTGALSHREIAARSSVGFFLFVPLGEDERQVREAGLELLLTEDVTPGVSSIAKRWIAAREAREEELRSIESAVAFDGYQQFLRVVELLARERRLSRFVFVAQKPGAWREQ